MRAVAFLCSLFAALCALVGVAHRHVAAWAPRATATDAVAYLPSGRALSLVVLGYEEIAADLIWARATLLFGGRYGTDADPAWYTWLYHMMDLATDLDPDFRSAYKYGGIMLRVDGRYIDQSSLVFGKGMHALPDDWYMPFGIAMNYFLQKEDKALAAEYMQIASRRPGAPFYLRNLAATLTDEGHGLENALAFLREERRALPEGRARDAVDVKIFEAEYLIAERAAAEVVSEHRRRVGSLPADPADVTRAGLELPPDPLGGTWAWNDAQDAPPGAVRSTRYGVVFAELAARTGLGGGSATAAEELGPAPAERPPAGGR